MTVAEVTAAIPYKAKLAVPGRVIPIALRIEAAVSTDEKASNRIVSSGCHVPELPLYSNG
jgi:hypothetical protein